MLADPTHAVRVELTSRRHVCTWLEQEPLSITNHYLDPVLAQTQTVLAQKTVDRSSRLRQHRLSVLLPHIVEREDLIAAMTDTVWPDDTPPPTVEPWQTGGVVSNWGTLHTVVITPSERRWDWALGVGDRPIQRQDFHTLYPLSEPVL